MLVWHRGRSALVLAALIACACTSLDDLTGIPDDAGHKGTLRTDRIVDFPDVNTGPDPFIGGPGGAGDAGFVGYPIAAGGAGGTRDAGRPGSRDSSTGGASRDAALGRLDGAIEATKDMSVGDSADGARNGWGWQEVGSDLELLESGVVRVMGTQKQCSGVIITHHWVLTAAHCLCSEDLGNLVHPESVIAGGGRFLNAQPFGERALYEADAVRIVIHPSLDVALIQLRNAVPFKVTPRLYPGHGLDLGKAPARALGFGPNRLNDAGLPFGSGETLTSARLSIQDRQQVDGQLEVSVSCDGGSQLPSSGPLARPPDGSRPKPVEGAEGGPLFVGDDDPETRELVGILKGTTDTDYAFTGIWEIRDWMRDVATDVSLRRDCSRPIPGSDGKSKPAVSEGPDGQLHVVALDDAGFLNHWQRAPDGTFAGPILTPLPRSDLPPALHKEARAPAGEAVKVGLLFRDAATQDIEYSRWPEQGSWSPPITIPGAQNARALALSNDGFIAFVKADRTVGGKHYIPETGLATFPDAPIGDIDVSRGFSSHLSGGFLGAIVWSAYRTPRNEWAEISGTFAERDGGGWIWKPPSKATQTDWQQAVLTGAFSNAGMIVATRSVGASTVVEHFYRLISQTETTQFIQVGSNRLNVAGDLAVGYTESDAVWVVTQSVDGEPPGLMLRRSTDCFANDW